MTQSPKVHTLKDVDKVRNVSVIHDVSVFRPGEVLPEDAEGGDGGEKQGRSIFSRFADHCSLHILCVLLGISPRLSHPYLSLFD